MDSGSAADAPLVRTTCPYCGVGCRVLAMPQRDGSVRIAGDPEHPANYGRLCVKGTALGETLGLDGRLLHPVDRSAGDVRVSWDHALDCIADRFSRTIAEHGRQAVAFYVSGQLLTEDYYVANKLMKGYIGAANIDTNSRLCMASAVAGHKRAFGADWVPVSYEDVEGADLVVLVGSNTAWCHPVLYQRILAARRRRPQLRIVVVDPRRTATCEGADLHLPIAPGSDVWLFNGLLAWLHQHGRTDALFVERRTAGLPAALDAAIASAGSLAQVARECRIGEDLLQRFYALFAHTPRVVTVFSMGVNQSSSGTDKVNAIINCHLLTGRVGVPGAGPFSLTGQPNAMGGREVGGLANQLAAHLELSDPAHRALVQRFWNSPCVADAPGHKAVELFEAVADGRVKALWIMATNPVVSLPDAERVRAALATCPFVVVSELMRDTDTTRHAHLLLPATGWGERDGSVTNSERRISRQRPFLPAPGEARPDWWIVCEVARRMGFGDCFSYTGPHEIFAEHARLSAFENGTGNAGSAVRRVFNIGGLANVDKAEYDALSPIRWPLPPVSQSPQDSGPRFNFVPLCPCPPARAPDDAYPLILNTGRVRDHWHTMSRTGKSAKLATHSAEPFLDIHPRDALIHGLRDGRLARVSTRWGACVLRVVACVDLPRGQIFVPIHWNGRTASDARVGALVNPALDPLSSQPEFKHTPARVEPFHVDWFGFLLTRQPPAMLDGPDTSLAWWARVQGGGFLRYEIAGRGRMDDCTAWAQRLLEVGADGDRLEISDTAEGLYRAAWIEDGRARASLYLAPRPEDLPPRGHTAALFGQERLAECERIELLAGRAAGGIDPGVTVCACHGVGRRQILDAVGTGCNSVEALGAELRCGTACGSCLPELRALLRNRPT